MIFKCLEDNAKADFIKKTLGLQEQNSINQKDLLNINQLESFGDETLLYNKQQTLKSETIQKPKNYNAHLTSSMNLNQNDN